MSEKHTDTKDAGAEPATGQSARQVVYSYESAGISEHEGNVPLWLWGVVGALLIWGVYYLIAYWSEPIVTT